MMNVLVIIHDIWNEIKSISNKSEDLKSKLYRPCVNLLDELLDESAVSVNVLPKFQKDLDTLYNIINDNMPCCDKKAFFLAEIELIKYYKTVSVQQLSNLKNMKEYFTDRIKYDIPYIVKYFIILATKGLIGAIFYLALSNIILLIVGCNISCSINNEKIHKVFPLNGLSGVLISGIIIAFILFAAIYIKKQKQ